jgi:cytochrome c553
VTCHLNDGRGDNSGGIPNLTIHAAPYAAQMLYSFRTGERANNRMLEVTESLTFEQMASLAAYVGSLPPQPGVPKVDAAAAARGQAIAEKGAADRNVPACLSCHDAKGTAELPLVPHLQGQSVVYLRERLGLFASPDGATLTSLNPMPGIANKLTDAERADLAAYFAAQAPVGKAN